MPKKTDYEVRLERAEELRTSAHYFLENGTQAERAERGDVSEAGVGALLLLVTAGVYAVLELAARAELLEITTEEELRELRDKVVEELELGRVELGAQLERLTAAVDELPGGDE